MCVLSSKSPENGFIFCFALILFTIPLSSAYPQSPEQLKFHAERIAFGEIEVKRNSLYELRNFESESASRVAIPALKDISEIVRATATHSVVYLPKDEAAQILLPHLNEKSRYVRRETAYALGKVGSPSATQRLVTVLEKDKEREVRTASAVALGLIGDVSAVEGLVSVLARKPKSKNIFLRRAAAKSIGQIAQNIQNQIPTITTPESFLPDKYKKVIRPRYRRLVEAHPVFETANRRLIIVLQNIKESGDVRREAAFALGEIGDAESIEVLKSRLNDPDYYLAEISKEALRKVYVSVNYSNSDSLPKEQTRNN